MKNTSKITFSKAELINILSGVFSIKGSPVSFSMQSSAMELYDKEEIDDDAEFTIEWEPRS